MGLEILSVHTVIRIIGVVADVVLGDRVHLDIVPGQFQPVCPDKGVLRGAVTTPFADCLVYLFGLYSPCFTLGITYIGACRAS